MKRGPAPRVLLPGMRTVGLFHGTWPSGMTKDGSRQRAREQGFLMDGGTNPCRTYCVPRRSVARIVSCRRPAGPEDRSPWIRRGYGLPTGQSVFNPDFSRSSRKRSTVNHQPAQPYQSLPQTMLQKVLVDCAPPKLCLDWTLPTEMAPMHSLAHPFSV
ncbi:hypothetical protein LZ31DRAFT_247427 [Colletotrichum somersetense]|nr:hypothetical protein LZ31DRAFT_247427 [Colletotrichum somersetense]